MRPPITSHVLNLGDGKPVEGLGVSLYKLVDSEWMLLDEADTNSDGRIDAWLENTACEPGIYRLVFMTQTYFDSIALETFYPEININFSLTDSDSHYHVPLLLNQYGYSTYRGS